MSSQSASGTFFSISAAQQPFRLLELPPELLDLLASPNPPKLCFKSPASKDPKKAPEAVLCTPDKTYLVRQQQTSNSVHILIPTSLKPNGHAIPEQGVSAISQCTSSLELLPAPPYAAKSLLRDQLPTFMDPEDAHRPSPAYLDKLTIFSNTPMSDAECQQEWTSLVAFELLPSAKLPRRCFCPTPTVLLKTWSRLLQIARSEAINLTGTLRTGTMLEALWDPDDEWPAELRAAIMQRLAPELFGLSEHDLAERALQTGSTLDRAVTVTWLGLLILQAQLESQPASPRLQKHVFVDQWKDHLPEEWRDDANIDKLPKDSYVLVSDYIRCVAPGGDTVVTEAAATPANANSTKPAPGNKRKWHEKFAAVRKQNKPA